MNAGDCDAVLWHGTQTGIAPELKPWGLWVRLPPVLLPGRPGEFVSDVRWAAGPSVNRPPFTGNVGSIPTRGTEGTARSSNGSGYQSVNLGMGVRFPYEPLEDLARSSSGTGRQVLNLLTGVRFPHGSLGRKPGTNCRRAGARLGLISLDAGFNSQVCN